MVANEKIEILKAIHGCKTIKELVLFYASDYSDTDYAITEGYDCSCGKVKSFKKDGKGMCCMICGKYYEQEKEGASPSSD